MSTHNKLLQSSHSVGRGNPDDVFLDSCAKQSTEEVLQSLTALYHFGDNVAFEELQTCITKVLQFVKSASEGDVLLDQSESYIRCITMIISPSFLQVILRMREKILNAAFDEETENAEVYPTIISCVDILFVHFSDMVVAIACNQCETKNVPDTLRKRLVTEALQLTSQLPRKLENFPATLGSKIASPAAKRLALTTLYALYVLRPDLEECDPWADTSVKSDEALECVTAYIEDISDKYRSMQLSWAEPMGCSLRITFAMAIAIYAQADYAQAEIPFRPFTHASLLELMTVIINPIESNEPHLIEELDESQALPLYWGSVVPWMWTRYDDSRAHQFETVVKLTSNWIYHIGNSATLQSNSVCVQEETDDMTQMSSSTSFRMMQYALRLRPNASIIALFLQWVRKCLSQAPLHLTSAEATLTVLGRTVSSFEGLLTSSKAELSPTTINDSITELLELYILLIGPTETPDNGKIVSIWDLADIGSISRSIIHRIVRIINARNTTVVEKALIKIQKDKALIGKISNAVSLGSRLASKKPEQQISVQDEACLICVLDFIALVCSTGVLELLPLDLTSTLLADTTALVSLTPSSNDLRTSHLTCLVAAYNRCRASKSTVPVDQNSALKLTRLWKEEDAYNIAINSYSTDAELAAAFASYVSLTIRKYTDTLLILETWDYLRDSMIILAMGRIYAEEIPKKTAFELATVAEKISKSMELILVRCEKSTAQFLIRSPMTLSLLDILRKPEEPLAHALQLHTEEVSFETENEAVPSRFNIICTSFLKRLQDIESKLSSEST